MFYQNMHINLVEIQVLVVLTIVSHKKKNKIEFDYFHNFQETSQWVFLRGTLCIYVLIL